MQLYDLANVKKLFLSFENVFGYFQGNVVGKEAFKRFFFAKVSVLSPGVPCFLLFIDLLHCYTVMLPDHKKDLRKIFIIHFF